MISRDPGGKSTIDDIRRRFDGDVERFSQLETGQSATMDAVRVLELVARSAVATTPAARSILDVGCGAGNYTVKLLGRLPGMSATLVDLSQPMLDRARARVTAATQGTVSTHQIDIRDLELPAGSQDVIVASMVLHHLRSEAEWLSVLGKFHRWLRPGGSLWISDLVDFDQQGMRAVQWEAYGEYLRSFKGEEYERAVLAYVDKEDTPLPLTRQLILAIEAGFARPEVIHAHAVFAAWGAVKG